MKPIYKPSAGYMLAAQSKRNSDEYRKASIPLRLGEKEMSSAEVIGKFWKLFFNGDRSNEDESEADEVCKAIESALEDAEFFHLCRWNGWHLCGQTDAGVQQWAIYDYHGSPITDFLPTYQEAIKVALAKEPKL
jgi:hypothetical protein